MPLGVVLIFWVEEIRIFDASTVEVLVPGGKTHFGLSDNKRKETVLAPPSVCIEMYHKVRELVDEVSNGVEGGLYHNCVDTA